MEPLSTNVILSLKKLREHEDGEPDNAEVVLNAAHENPPDLNAIVAVAQVLVSPIGAHTTSPAL